MMRDEKNTQEHNFVNLIKYMFPKAVIDDPQISEHSRKVIFAGLSNFVALKGEELVNNYLENYLKNNSRYIKQKSHKPQICDCIIFKFNDDVIIGIIDMKGKNPDSGEIEGQLGNGKILAFKVMDDVNAKLPVADNFIFLILTKPGGYSRLKVSGNRRNKQKPELKINGCPVIFRGPVVYFADEVEKKKRR
jgi:hypothetical protein